LYIFLFLFMLVLGLDAEDFHLKDTTKPVRITVTFTDLTAAAQDDFREYYRQEKLIICAEAAWNDAGKGQVHQYGHRMAMKPFTPFFAKMASGARADELKTVYRELKTQFSDLPTASTKGDMEEALHTYEAAHPELCTAIKSSDQFYGFTKGSNRLAKYIQWVYIPAVKDASDEQVETKTSALGRLLARTVRATTKFDDVLKTIRSNAQDAYNKMLDGQRGALTTLSDALGKRLGDWAHGDAKLRLAWRQDPDKSIRVEDPLAQIIAGEGPFEGDLLRFGHGLQRCVLLALLQVLAAHDDVEGPRLLLGIEEPELYQHPPQAKHLAQVLQTLTRVNAQVLLCTHSPFFVSGQGFADIRLLRKCPVHSVTSVTQAGPEEVEGTLANAAGDKKPLPKAGGLLARIHQSLQPALNEMFFTHILILLEGIEDLAYISTYLHLTEQWDDMRRCGCHFVPVNGKEHLLRPLAIAKHLAIPTFTVCDSDSHKYGKPPELAWDEGKKQTHIARATQHAKENIAIQRLAGRTIEEDFIAADVWEYNLVMFHSTMGDTVESAFPVEDYRKAEEAVQASYGHSSGMQKNFLAISDRLHALWDFDHRSPPLQKLCDSILTFARSHGHQGQSGK
jgi:putative ATP-dependent endonuclease of the OLD family